MAIIWKLKIYLQEHQITANALSEHVKGKLSKTSIYNLVGDKQPSGVHFATLDILIPALTDLTGQPVTLHDLLEYAPDSSVGWDWRSSIGMLSEEAENDS